MSNITRKTKTQHVEHEVYVTTDGQEFDFEFAAEDHQKRIDGKRKECPSCGGSGQVNWRNEEVWVNLSWIPTAGEYQTKVVSDTCHVCKGKGYLELEEKWV